MTEGEAGDGWGPSNGDRSVRGDRLGGPASAAEPRPVAPTRRWEMNSQEQDMMARFRRDFLELLDGRVTKIGNLIASRQLEPANIAMLSLESSSAMVGSTDLAAVVRQLRSALEQGRFDEVDTLLAQVPGVAEAARRSLEDGPG